MIYMMDVPELDGQTLISYSTIHKEKCNRIQDVIEYRNFSFLKYKYFLFTREYFKGL